MISQNGFETILLTHVNPVAALFSSVVVFLVVAYAESQALICWVLELLLAVGNSRKGPWSPWKASNSFGIRI